MKLIRTTIPARLFITSAFIPFFPLTPSALAQHLQILSVEIERKPIFDETTSLVQNLMNEARITTSESVIRGELLFAEGEPYRGELVQESERNLRNMGIFSDVRVVTDTLPGGLARIRVITRERWTFSASAMMTQEAGIQSKYIRLSEKNLLGKGKRISFNYNHSSLRTGNPHGFQAGYEDRRIFGSRWTTLFQYRDAEEYRSVTLRVDRPFFSEQTEWATGIIVGSVRERLWYDPQAPEAPESFRFHTRLQVWHVRSFGGDVKVRIGGAFRRFRIRALPQFIGPAHHMDLVSLSAGVLARQFSQTSHIDDLGSVEYLQTGHAATVIAGLNPSSVPEHHNAWFFRAGLRTGMTVTKDAAVFANFSASTFTDFAQVRDASIVAETSFFDKITRQSTLAGRFFLIHGISWSPVKRFALGGMMGLRGYGYLEFMETSAALLNLEYRIFPDVEIMYFKPALALFLDSGTTWWEHERFSKQQWHSAAGFGLRIGNRRLLGSTVIRIDFVRNLTTREWGQVILSTGQFFGALGQVDTDSPTASE